MRVSDSWGWEPLIAGGNVYGLGARGDLFAVDFKTGKEIWKTHLVEDHDAKKPHYGFATSPVMVDGVLIVEISAPDPEVAEGEEKRIRVKGEGGGHCGTTRDQERHRRQQENRNETPSPDSVEDLHDPFSASER